MKRAARVAAIFAVLFTWSCADAVEPVPPIPTPSLEGVAPEVRDAVLAAHRQAVAEPDNGTSSGRLGMVLQANTLYAPAAQAYQRAIRLNPDEFAWRYYLALTLQQQSLLEEAVDAIGEALRIRPDYTPAVIQRGELLFKLGRFKESNKTLEPLLKKNPKSAEALYALAQVKYAQEELRAAEDLYSRALSAYTTFGAAYYGLAVTRQRLGGEAESTFELAERYKGDSPQGSDPLLDQIRALSADLLSRVNRAQRMIQQGELSEAWQLLRQVLERDPYHLDALLNVLYLGPVDGQPAAEEMETFYNRARQMAPRNPQVYLYYGMTLSTLNRNTAAISTLNKAVELKPDYAEAHTLLGMVLDRENRGDQAIQHFRLALAAQPAYRPAQLQLSQTLVKKGRYREAIPELHRVLEVVDADTSVTLVYLATAYANSGDAGKAREYLQHARTRVLRTGPPALLEQIEQGLRQLGWTP